MKEIYFKRAHRLIQTKTIIKLFPIASRKNWIKKDRKEENISDLKIGIVTNNFHIFRSKNIAMDIGFSNVYGISAKTPLIAIPKAHVREFFSIIKYFWKKMNK